MNIITGLNEKWDCTEVHPVAHVGEGCMEQVEKGQEDFWSVYVHLVSGGIMCVADVDTEEQAERLAILIEELGQTKAS